MQKELSDKRTDKFFIFRDLGVDIEGLKEIQLEKLVKSGSKIIKKRLEEKKDDNTIKEELAKQLVIKREMIKIRSQNANQREQTKSWVEKITSGFGEMLRSGKSK